MLRYQVIDCLGLNVRWRTSENGNPSETAVLFNRTVTTTATNIDTFVGLTLASVTLSILLTGAAMLQRRKFDHRVAIGWCEAVILKCFQRHVPDQLTAGSDSWRNLRLTEDTKVVQVILIYKFRES